VSAFVPNALGACWRNFYTMTKALWITATIALLVFIFTVHNALAWDLPDDALTATAYQSSALPLRFPIIPALSSSSYVRILNFRASSGLASSAGYLSCGSSVVGHSQGNTSGTSVAPYSDNFSLNYRCIGQTVWFTQVGTGNQLGSRSVQLNYLENEPSEDLAYDYDGATAMAVSLLVFLGGSGLAYVILNRS